MAGIAGAQIGVAGAQPLIAQVVALVQGTTSARGCTTNFIGFGLGLSSAEPLPPDFNATDDTVLLGIVGTPDYAPTYTAIPGNATHQTLTWGEVVVVAAAAAAEEEEEEVGHATPKTKAKGKY